MGSCYGNIGQKKWKPNRANTNLTSSTNASSFSLSSFTVYIHLSVLSQYYFLYIFCFVKHLMTLAYLAFQGQHVNLDFSFMPLHNDLLWLLYPQSPHHQVISALPPVAWPQWQWNNLRNPHSCVFYVSKTSNTQMSLKFDFKLVINSCSSESHQEQILFTVSFLKVKHTLNSFSQVGDLLDNIFSYDHFS